MIGGLFKSSPKSQTSTTTIAEYVEDPVKSLIADAVRVAGMPYVGYEGPRIAGLTAPTQAAISDVQSRFQQGAPGRSIYDALMGGTMMQTPGREANIALQQQIGREQLPGQVAREQFQQQVAREQLPSWVGGLSGAGISSLMDPYQRMVSDITARELTRRSDIAGQQDRAAAVRAGAFGGSRQAVLEAERRRNLEQQVGDVYTQGGSQAFNTAIQSLLQQRMQDIGQRGTDIGATIQQRAQDIEQRGTDINAALRQREQDIGQRGTDIGAMIQQRAQDIDQRGTDISSLLQQRSQNINQRGQDIGMEQARTQAALAAGQQGFGQEQAMTQNMLGIGSLLQGQTQANLDLAYSDFLRQQQNPQQQLGFLSNMIRGVPYSSTTTSQVSGGGASPFQQLLGTAIGIGSLSMGSGAGTIGGSIFKSMTS